MQAMQLYKSAFHPDSGELQNVFGRMSFQVNTMKEAQQKENKRYLNPILFLHF